MKPIGIWILIVGDDLSSRRIQWEGLELIFLGCLTCLRKLSHLQQLRNAQRERSEREASFCQCCPRPLLLRFSFFFPADEQEQMIHQAVPEFIS